MKMPLERQPVKRQREELLRAHAAHPQSRRRTNSGIGQLLSGGARAEVDHLWRD